MAERVVEQISVRLNAEQKALLDKCHERYPALSRAGLFVQLLYEWQWLHEAGNNKSARLERIEENTKKIITILKQPKGTGDV
jgi:hypothetical protein